MMRRLSRAGLLGVAVAALAAASAAPAAQITETTVTKTASQVVPLTSTPPCLGTATITYTDIFHITDFGNGTLHVSDAQAGTVVFVSASSGATYTGRYSGTFNHQSNPPGAQFTEGGTFHLIATTSDGSSSLQFLITFHVTSTPAGDFSSEIDAVRCSLA
jgi:hypothetical protein